MYALYKVDFTEYESGWGCRPDDIIVGLDYQSVLQVATGYCNRGSYNCYSRMNSEPYLVEVSKELYEYIQEANEPLMLMRTDREKFGIKYGR